MTFDLGQAANFIAFFEGYAPLAQWDVNAYRLGFGSDTEGPMQTRVTRGMTTTRARALENLAVRVPAFVATICGQIGSARWLELGQNTQMALASYAYNYGHLTGGLEDAVVKGAGISTALWARGVDNNGVNAKRRFAEAAMAASDGV